jgi:D-alanine-D-alanine ligase
MKVLVLHSLPLRRDRTTLEFAVSDAAACIANTIENPHVEGVRGELHEVLGAFEKHQPDVVFNCCEAPLGRPDREHHVAALLEWLGIAFTGSGSECLALCRRKDRVNPLLVSAGIRTPRTSGGHLDFPCIVKPADEDGSYGIWTGSICENDDELDRARAHVPGRVLIEQFLPGREFLVSLWGGAQPEHHAIGETRFTGGLRLRTYAGKWRSETHEFRSTPITYASAIAPALRTALVELATRAWHVVEARGYLNVDLRLDRDDIPHVIDVNPNPELTPGFGIHRAVTETGWDWARFVERQLQWALLFAR